MTEFLRRFRNGWSQRPTVPMPTPEHWGSYPVTAPSVVEGADFTGTLTIWWRGSEADRDKVRVAVTEFVERRAKSYRVTAADALAAQVNAQGAAFRPLSGTALLIAYRVVLAASEEALALTAAWEEAQRQETMDELRQQRELRQLQYLRDEIFRRPDIARMYWHTKHPNDLSMLTSPAFEDVAACLAGGAGLAPARDVPPVAALIGEFLAGLDGDERSHLIAQLDVVFRAFNRSDLAERLPAGATAPIPPAPLSE